MNKTLLGNRLIIKKMENMRQTDSMVGIVRPEWQLERDAREYVNGMSITEALNKLTHLLKEDGDELQAPQG